MKKAEGGFFLGLLVIALERALPLDQLPDFFLERFCVCLCVLFNQLPHCNSIDTHGF